MKTLRIALLLLGFSFAAPQAAHATPLIDSPRTEPAATGPAAPIPFAELGAKATADYKGDALGITATPDGATLRTGFQKLAGTVTGEGLLLESTEEADVSLQLKASAVGRVAAPSSTQDYDGKKYSRALARPILASGPRDVVPLRDAFTREQRFDGLKPETTLRLPALGHVTNTATLFTFTRPGLIEEYSVSADGVRQDFIVAQCPAGSGQLSVELALSGATAEAAADGSKLTLSNSGRVLASIRLHVTDATGKALAASRAVLSLTRLAVQVEDADAL